MPPSTDALVVIVGAGAAGLATAIFLARQAGAARIVLVDGARAPGAKILVSGGSRCNVTNTVVTEADFNGGSRAAIRRVLRAFPAQEAAAFFRDLGVPLHEEAGGKLFPDSGRSRDVLDALLAEMRRLGVALESGRRVHAIDRIRDHFSIATSRGTLTSAFVVLATGGLSLPKTGSDGAGYELARRFGHTIVATTPALAPLRLGDAAEGRPTLAGTPSPHHRLSGVSQPVELTLTLGGRVATRISGSMLWTHFGISGPAALDMSRHWLRAELEGHTPVLTARLAAAPSFDALDAEWTARVRELPRSMVHGTLAQDVPASVATALLEALVFDSRETLATLTRDNRRRLVHALTAWPLPVVDSRGYNYAEVTAGGIALGEIDPGTMHSRREAGLYAVGEILDVDGRLGGFNFQWAWSSGFVAARAIAARIASRRENGATAV